MGACYRNCQFDVRTHAHKQAWYAASNNKPTALRILLRHGADLGAFVAERDGKKRTLSDVATCVRAYMCKQMHSLGRPT